MRRFGRVLTAAAVCAAVVLGPFSRGALAQDLSAKKVLEAIDRAKRFLVKGQNADGSWRSGAGDTWAVGTTSLALLALINTGMTADDAEIQKGLKWLRKQDPTSTYEISLMIQALAAAKDGTTDKPRVLNLVHKLESSQIRQGDNTGSWSYGIGFGGGFGGDRSNGQFAVLGLREAQEMGVPVSLDVWKRARQHWETHQNPDGGWGYSGPPGGGSSGSMTVAGIATMVITEAMVRAGQKELNPDGTPICCNNVEPDKSLEDAARWMGNNFAVGHNPGGNHWLLYYLYGLERAGRFSGRRFFVNSRGDKHDWYREGAEYLVAQQNKLTGSWAGVGQSENEPNIGTSFALMFLSKGLAPVLINKLQFGPRDAAGKVIVGNDWNRRRDDVRNLTQHISGLPKWPKLLTWQVVDVSQATVADLMQSPIAFFSGTERPHFTSEDVALLKEYVQQGGFIFADCGCRSAAFDEGFRDLIKQMYPPSEAQLRKLGADHPVYRAEYNLIDRETGEPVAELWGVDVGCRTSIIYSPHDLSCLWDKWTSFEIPNRPKELMSMIAKSNRVGVNVVAYVTGRQPFNKLEQQELVVTDAPADKVERGLLQVAKLRYAGDWDAAPQALRNLLTALNRTAGTLTSTKQRDLAAVDPNLFKYPLLYMHGRHDFAMGKAEQDRLREYIQNGGVLFSDSCCGAPQYEKSFRRLMEQLFPENKLKRIPPDHEMFTTRVGYDLKTVKRREPDVNTPNAALSVSVKQAEPFLEGIEVNGRYVVIFSKYDISCALERQASVACTGYVHEDAVRIGVNVVLYALLQ